MEFCQSEKVGTLFQIDSDRKGYKMKHNINFVAN